MKKYFSFYKSSDCSTNNICKLLCNMNLSGILVFFLFCFFLLSCINELELFNNKLKNSSLVNRSNEDIFPLNINNTLKFRNLQHAVNYYNFIDSIANSSEDSDSVLSEIEEILGFISARSLTPKIFSDTSAITLNDSNFIADDIRKSILNQFNEFEIGDTTYIYQNKDEIYKVLNSDRNVILALRETPKGLPLPDSLFTENTFLISSDRTNRKVDVLYFRSSPCPNCKWTISTFKTTNCFNRYEGEIYIQAKCDRYDFYSNFSVRIDWGDNSENEIVNGTGFWYHPKHKYSEEGTYNVKLLFYNSCDEITVIHENKFEFRKECFGHEENNGWWPKINIGGKTYSAYNYIWTTTDFFGTWAGAKISSFEVLSENNYKAVKAKLSVEVNSNFRNKDCVPKEVENDIDFCNSCKSKSVKVHESWYNRYHIDQDDVWATYEMEINGNKLTKNLKLYYSDCD